MVRAFETHKIRKTRELSGSLWDFQTLPEEGDAVRLKTPVPGCWQSEPDTLTYRGKACYERRFSAIREYPAGIQGGQPYSTGLCGRSNGSGALQCIHAVLCGGEGPSGGRTYAEGLRGQFLRAGFCPACAERLSDLWRNYTTCGAGRIGGAYVDGLHFTPYLRRDSGMLLWKHRWQICRKNLLRAGSCCIWMEKGSEALLRAGREDGLRFKRRNTSSRRRRPGVRKIPDYIC